MGHIWPGDQANSQLEQFYSVWARTGPGTWPTVSHMCLSVWAKPGPHNTIGALQCLGQNWVGDQADSRVLVSGPNNRILEFYRVGAASGPEHIVCV